MSTDDQSSPPESHAPQSRGMRAVLRRFRRGLKGEDRAERHHGEAAVSVAGSGVDIVDQAEVFKTLRVSDVMTPRADINALDISTDFAEVVRCFAEHEHSRMPVYRDTLDDPVGVVNIKDVFKLLADGGGAPQPADPVLHRLRREVLYVPASMRAADLLLRMQSIRIHMALVIDEFGGTDGLVTMEDLVEAVVGDIADEYDEAVPAHIVARPAGVFEADARASLEELEAALGEPVFTEEDVEEEIDTVGGLVATLAGRVPQRGEVITHPGGFEFEVTDADPRRIKHVRIRKTQRPAVDAASPKPADEL
ncbi:MAG: hemolysin family protein [Caulobacteraceae bacterium]